jgi:hypothetical protein
MNPNGVFGPLPLFLTEFDLLEFLGLALTTNDCLFTTVALAHGLLKILCLFGTSNDASLLNLARKPAQNVLNRLFRIFTCYLYHKSYCNVTEMIYQAKGVRLGARLLALLIHAL